MLFSETPPFTTLSARPLSQPPKATKLHWERGQATFHARYRAIPGGGRAASRAPPKEPESLLSKGDQASSPNAALTIVTRRHEPHHTSGNQGAGSERKMSLRAPADWAEERRRRESVGVVIGRRESESRSAWDGNDGGRFSIVD